MFRAALFVLVLSLLITSAAKAGLPSRLPRGDTSAGGLRLLVIGNSFSGNALSYLIPMAEAGGHKLILGHAKYSGGSMRHHLNAARTHEADPSAPAGKPYVISISRDVKARYSLKEMLQAQPWDYVTIQQASYFSYQIESYRPDAQDLVNYVHRYCPNAKIILHETWAWGINSQQFASGKLNQHLMYERLHAAYRTIAPEVGAVGIIPVGTAFQNARQDPRLPVKLPENVDLTQFQFPEVPKQENALTVSYVWGTKDGQRILSLDTRHATPAGEYLGSAVWYSYFFGDVRQNSFQPRDVPERDAQILREIAYRTVHENLRPKPCDEFLAQPPSTPTQTDAKRSAAASPSKTAAPAPSPLRLPAN